MAYIYEYIRTRGHEPLHFEKHYARLEELATTYFSEPLKASPQELQRAIAESLQHEKCSTTTMNVVYVQYFSDGTIKVKSDWSIYNSFSLRALRPHSYLRRVSGTIITDNTSAKESIVEFDRDSALIADKGVAIWANERDEVIAIDGAPVVAVFEEEIRFSQTGKGVEFDLAYEIVSSNKHNVSKGVITLEELPKAKEILFIDHRGVTAVQLLYDLTIYMDITAEKIASQIAEAE
jgi:branched-subunit amino acid aminotransferase/4-amino-4-deoxychorismate lyase